jgi:hypothetical protein
MVASLPHKRKKKRGSSNLPHKWKEEDDGWKEGEGVKEKRKKMKGRRRKGFLTIAKIK